LGDEKGDECKVGTLWPRKSPNGGRVGSCIALPLLAVVGADAIGLAIEEVEAPTMRPALEGMDGGPIERKVEMGGRVVSSLASGWEIFRRLGTASSR